MRLFLRYVALALLAAAGLASAAPGSHVVDHSDVFDADNYFSDTPVVRECGTEMSITDVNPAFAYATVPTEVVVTGCNLGGGDWTSTVHMLNVACTVTEATETQIKCKTGVTDTAAGLGAVQVTRANDDTGASESVSRRNMFMYYQPKVESVHPATVDAKAGATIRLVVSGMYFDDYEVSFAGAKATKVEMSETFMLVTLPEAGLTVGSLDITISNAMLTTPVLVKSRALAVTDSGAEPFVKSLLPTWAVGPVPAPTFKLVLGQVPADVAAVSVTFAGIKAKNVKLDAATGVITGATPACTADTCLGTRLVLVSLDGKEVGSWTFTYLAGPVTGTANVYPGPALPCNYNHDMLVTFAGFDGNVPALIKLGAWEPEGEHNLVVVSNGFRFDLAAADAPYASGAVQLIDDAGNVVYDGGKFTHGPAVDGVAITRVISKPMEIGAETAVTFYGYGFTEHDVKSFVAVGARTAAAAAGGSADVTLDLTTAGVTQSRATGYLTDCSDFEDRCQAGSFDVALFNSKNERVAVVPGAVVLQYNNNFGILASYTFLASAKDKTLKAVAAFAAAAAELTAVPAARVAAGTVAGDTFTVQVLPAHGSIQPDAETLADSIEVLVADELSDLHKKVAGVATVVGERQTLRRCGANDYRVKCGNDDGGSGGDDHTWIYVCVGMVCAAIVAGFAIYVCKKRADQRRAVGILDDHYSQINE